MKKIFKKIILFLILLIPITSFAFSPEGKLPNEAQEAQAMKLFLEIRCLACQGQAIESSNSEFAVEMRRMIRSKIASGKSNNQIIDELVEEFGDDILLKPNLKHQPLLWVLPLLCLIYGLMLLKKNFWKKKEE